MVYRGGRKRKGSACSLCRNGRGWVILHLLEDAEERAVASVVILVEFAVYDRTAVRYQTKQALISGGCEVGGEGGSVGNKHCT